MIPGGSFPQALNPGIIYLNYVMPQLTEDQQHETARLLGFYDDLEAFNVYRSDFENDYTQPNYDRILEIIEIITRKPDSDDPCDNGGIEYQLDNSPIGTNLKSIDKMMFDNNAYIKRLRITGDALIKELSNIMSIPIHFNKFYSASRSKSFISYW